MEASRFSQGGQDQPTRGELKIESWKIQLGTLRRLPPAGPIQDLGSRGNEADSV
jgi:hypothetical protein